MPLFKAPKKGAQSASNPPVDPQWAYAQQQQMQYDPYGQMGQGYMQPMPVSQPMQGQMGYSQHDQQQYYAQGYPQSMMTQQQQQVYPAPVAEQQLPPIKSKKPSSLKSTSQPFQQQPTKSLQKSGAHSSQQPQQQVKPPSPVDSIAGGGGNPTQDLFESEDYDPGDETDSNIRVIIRVRPPNQLELRNGYTKILECDKNHRSIWIASQDGRDRPLSFNRVYDQDVTQGRFFEESGIKDLINKSLDG
jgi:hypothetical protein